jgi:hypothetical protein
VESMTKSKPRRLIRKGYFPGPRLNGEPHDVAPLRLIDPCYLIDMIDLASTSPCPVSAPSGQSPRFSLCYMGAEISNKLFTCA